MTANSVCPPHVNPSEGPDNARRQLASVWACQNPEVRTDLPSYWRPSGECRFRGTAMADSFPDAARRHRNDARSLAASNRFQNAGHLLGFAAECLAKEILLSAGITIDKTSGFREHFPALGRKIRTHGRTRVMALLTPVVSSTTFLSGWEAEGRYEQNVPMHNAEARFKSWQVDVDSLFRAAGVP